MAGTVIQMSSGGPQDGGDLARFLSAAEGVLRRYRHLLDELNVVPVADSDTGSNLVSTVAAAAAAADGSSGAPIERVRGALFDGATGNSGVILAQALSAGLEVWAGGLATRHDLGLLLDAWAGGASDAVVEVLPGSLVTALGDLSRQFGDGTAQDLAEALGEAVRLAHETVIATRHQNPVLESAGVVDAGALGGALVIDALASSLLGLAETQPPVWSAAGKGIDELDLPLGVPSTGFSGPRWEVVCTLTAGGPEVERLVAAWQEVGESIAHAGHGRTWRLHIHTDRVDMALGRAGAVGPLEHVSVSDLASTGGLHRHDELGFPASVVVDLSGPDD